MTPEIPPPEDRDHRNETHRPRGEPPFGPEAQASVDRSLAILRDPDDALRILAHLRHGGAGFAAFLLLPDTNLAGDDIGDRFADSYIDAWQRFDQFRTDALEGLGWTDALKKVMTEQGIPADHVTWNHAAIDRQILATYDAIHLDGWWHIFNK